MGVWRDIKARLGLGDDYDDDYEDYDDADEADEPAPAYRSPYEDEPTTIRRIDRKPDIDRAREAARQAPPVAPGPGMQAVPQVKMQIVEPRSYGEVQAIADKFKSGVPVIMNLTMTDPDLSRRLIDFASGLTYGLNGGLQKVSDRVFMLSPANVDVSATQRVMRDKGFFGLDD